MLGADGPGGSIWPLVGDALLQAGESHVMFTVVSVGGSPVRSWVDPNDLGGQLEHRLAEVDASGIAFTHVLWQQGESDHATSPEDYEAQLRRVLAQVRKHQPHAAFLVARSTRCDSQGPPSAAIAEAQARVAPGPNTDAISDAEDRVEGCHFSKTGAIKAAAAWAASVASNPAPVPAPRATAEHAAPAAR
jgi:hypothetical protein